MPAESSHLPLSVADALATQSTSAVISSIITHALARNASDIHIELHATVTQVRVRIAGSLSPAYTLPSIHHHAYVARLKALAGLRLDERSSAHDGRFTFSDTVDVRVSIVPARYGEKAVLRLLVAENVSATLIELGMSPADMRALKRTLTSRTGLILIAGSTGSGKTTTLYALLRMLSHGPRSVVSIEDPIEYTIGHITQIAVTKAFSCATALRAVLRQDPDVIAVGEIRDAETALLATEAALTGHVVLTTIHARSANGAVCRLESLGCSPQLVRESLVATITQRLIDCEGSTPARHGTFSVHMYEKIS